jgi:hypothetical protein
MSLPPGKAIGRAIIAEFDHSRTGEGIFDRRRFNLNGALGERALPASE